MAFYIKPPFGSVPLYKLQNFVMKRVAFLYYIHDHSVEDVFKIIIKESLVMNSECLIEGTVKDKVSHFTLRLLATSSTVVEDFFIQNETKLFSYRLQFCDISRIQQMFQKACDQSKFILCNNDNIFSYYENVLKSFILVSRELNFTMKNNESYIKVPFTAALKFIKERSYPLHLGYIILPLNNLKSLCIYMFEELLVQGVNQAKKSCLKKIEDPQMIYINQKIVKWIHSKFSTVKIPSNKPIYRCNLTTLSKKFPLCMRNLHDLLIKHHRLRHVSRIQFILFLKEIGIPSDEVIKIFKKEYSIPFAQTDDLNHAPCSHNWTKNENKYIYSIEHLYGKRGSRKNYRAHSCFSLQNSYDSEGGCPFASFDSQHLQKALKNDNLVVKDIEDIVTLAQENKYNEACCFYLRCKIDIQKSYPANVINDSNFPLLSSIKKPSDFYSIMSSNFEGDSESSISDSAQKCNYQYTLHLSDAE